MRRAEDRRARFARALSHTPGSAPLRDFLAHRTVEERLKARLGVSGESELLDALNADFFYLPGRDLSQNEGYLPLWKKAAPLCGERRVCPLGITFARGAGSHKFMVDEAADGPLRTATSVADVLRLPLPAAADFDFSVLAQAAEEGKGRIRVGGLWTGIMGDSYRLMGFERFLFSMAEQPQLVAALIDRMTDMYLQLNDKCFTQLKGSLDIWFFGNDFGSQNGMLLSPDMWRDFFYRPVQRLCALARRHGLAVMMHSCGGIAPIIGDLIDAGVQILDPVQLTARGMDAPGLCERFGDSLVFHGGIDTQGVLVSGTPADVSAHVAAVSAALGKKGGYILAPSQVLGPDIPTDNALAMYA